MTSDIYSVLSELDALKFSFGNSGHSFYAGSQGFPLIKSQSRSNSIFKIHLNSICFVKVQILAHVSVILIPCSFPFSTGEKFLEWEISELEIFVDTFLATRFWWHFPLLEEPRVTAKPHGFLYIDTDPKEENMRFRSGFNEFIGGK